MSHENGSSGFLGDMLKRVWQAQQEIKDANNKMEQVAKDAINEVELAYQMERDRLRETYRRLNNLESELKRDKDFSERNGHAAKHAEPSGTAAAQPNRIAAVPGVQGDCPKTGS